MGTTLKHSYQPNGKGAATTESLSQPDDIVTLGGNLYVGFQNGVGSQGEVSTSGNLDSTPGTAYAAVGTVATDGLVMPKGMIFVP